MAVISPQKNRHTEVHLTYTQALCTDTPKQQTLIQKVQQREVKSVLRELTFVINLIIVLFFLNN